MKIYNPQETIDTDKFTFRHDSYIEFEVEEGKEMLKKYPFLVDAKTMTPDDCNDVRRSGVDTVISKRDTSQLIEVIEKENIKVIQRLEKMTDREKTNQLLIGQMKTNQSLKEITQELKQFNKKNWLKRFLRL